MPIFVTGGTGFLGINLVRMLVSRGHRCRLFVRPTSSRLGLDLGGIEFVHGDITDRHSLQRAMDGCDRVFHLAAWVEITPWGMSEARRVNVEGTRNVVEAALETGIERLVHTSSVATIGSGSLDHPADETTECAVRDCHTPYYQTKREAEEVVLDAVDRGLDAVIVNPTYLVGPWDAKLGAGRMLTQAVAGRLRIVPRRGGINFVDVRRVAEGQWLALEKGRTGRRYILGGENLSYRAFLDRIAKLSGVDVARMPMPYAALFPFAAVGSVCGRMFPRAFRDANLSVLRSAFLEHFVRSDRARDELGFEVASIDDAIHAAITWFSEEGYIGASHSPILREPALQNR